MNNDWKKVGLVEVCDVCGEELLPHQKLGKKKSNDALCHEQCLYYKVGNKIVSKEIYVQHINQTLKNNAAF